MRLVPGERGDETEILEIESRRDVASDQRVLAEAAGGLPFTGVHDAGGFLCDTRGAEHATLQWPRARPVGEQLERRAAGEMPGLVGFHHVPAAELRPLQQEIDRGEGAARPARSLQ